MTKRTLRTAFLMAAVSSSQIRPSTLPPREWVPVSSSYRSTPRLSLGTYEDIQAGDMVTLAKHYEDVDWTGCPGSSEAPFCFNASWTVTVHGLVGRWFYPAEFPGKIAPIKALGFVNLLGKEYQLDQRIAAESNSTSLGHDEDWCANQDVDRLTCVICQLVARDAMVHHCGSVLFCKICWVRCLARDRRCAFCREDGSSVVPAYFERRFISNLLVRCPNDCGGAFGLKENTERHLKDLCPKRRVKCSRCGALRFADAAEEHNKRCEAEKARTLQKKRETIGL